MAGTVAGLTAICYAELASRGAGLGLVVLVRLRDPGRGCRRSSSRPACYSSTASRGGRRVGWSQYLNELLDNLVRLHDPESLFAGAEQGGILNLPAVILVGLCALLLLRGASESAKVNAVMVLIKIGVLVLFIVVGLQGWTPTTSRLRAVRVQRGDLGRGIIFFSYIGLDAVSTAGEEVKNPGGPAAGDHDRARHGHHPLHPGRDRRGRGAARRAVRGPGGGLAAILEDVTGSSWPGTVLAAGAVISIFSVTLVVIYGQTRSCSRWPATGCCRRSSTR